MLKIVWLSRSSRITDSKIFIVVICLLLPDTLERQEQCCRQMSLCSRESLSSTSKKFVTCSTWNYLSTWMRIWGSPGEVRRDFMYVNALLISLDTGMCCRGCHLLPQGSFDEWSRKASGWFLLVHSIRNHSLDGLPWVNAVTSFLQCFDTVCCMTAMASNLWKLLPIHRVKWRHISMVAIRSPFCRSRPSYCA